MCKIVAENPTIFQNALAIKVIVGSIYDVMGKRGVCAISMANCSRLNVYTRNSVVFTVTPTVTVVTLTFKKLNSNLSEK